MSTVNGGGKKKQRKELFRVVSLIRFRNHAPIPVGSMCLLFLLTSNEDGQMFFYSFYSIEIILRKIEREHRSRENMCRLHRTYR